MNGYWVILSHDFWDRTRESQSRGRSLPCNSAAACFTNSSGLRFFGWQLLGCWWNVFVCIIIYIYPPDPSGNLRGKRNVHTCRFYSETHYGRIVQYILSYLILSYVVLYNSLLYYIILYWMFELLYYYYIFWHIILYYTSLYYIIL